MSEIPDAVAGNNASPPEALPGGAWELPSMAIQALLSTGSISEFVICAGARNAALLVLLSSAPGVRLWHHFEERSAAFFALGRILAHGHPVAVVTTSGTAAAELLPAMIEAHYQGLPLVAITADRPAHYRGSGAPQAIEQAQLFGPYPSLALDLTDAAAAQPQLARLPKWDRTSPLHLNLCLREPAAEDLPRLRQEGERLRISPDKDVPSPLSVNLPVLPGMDNPLILLGDLMPDEIRPVRQLLENLQRPIYAEGASGLRECPRLSRWLVPGGDLALSRVPHDSVIRLGGVPACRFWRDLENRPGIPVLSLSRSGHPGLARQSVVLPLNNSQRSLPGSSSKPHPFSVSTETAAPVNRRAAETAADLQAALDAHPASEPALIRSLSLLIPLDAVVFTGNSLAIREWNLCADHSAPRHARALRGANGIDGNLSAFLGAAADAGEGWCLTGDLTALYDLAAPWMLAQLTCRRIRFAVIQNGGGKIFSQLPSLAGLSHAEKNVMENPHQVSLAGWASQWGMEHLVCQGQAPAASGLPERVVLEIHPDPAATAAFWKTWSGEKT